MLRLRLALATCALAGAACYKPAVGSGELRCAEGGQCPSGFACAADATCWKTGEPLRAPDAPPEVVCVPQVRAAVVTWLPPLHTGGSPITRYSVTSSPGGFTATTLDTVVVVDGLDDGATYTFTVTAENAIGRSSDSPPSAPLTTPGPPDAPSGLTVVPGNGQAFVAWTAPSSSIPILTYTVTSDPPAASATVAAPSATLFLLKNGTSYTFTVYATSDVGNGPLAVSAPATPSGPPGPPVIDTVIAGVRSASINFTAPDDGGSAITSYKALASKSGGAFLPAAATVSGGVATVGGLDNGGSYSFEIVVTNAKGDSPPSLPSVAVTVPDVPTKPLSVNATSGSGTAQVGWAAPASDGGASILGYTAVANPGGQTVTVTGTSASFSGLTPGTPVTFRVLATNAVGDGPLSDPSGPVTPVRPSVQIDVDGDGRPDRVQGTAEGVRITLADGNSRELRLGAAATALALLDGGVIAIAGGEVVLLRADGAGGLRETAREGYCEEPCALGTDGQHLVAAASEMFTLLYADGDALEYFGERPLERRAASVEPDRCDWIVRDAAGFRIRPLKPR